MAGLERRAKEAEEARSHQPWEKAALLQQFSEESRKHQVELQALREMRDRVVQRYEEEEATHHQTRKQLAAARALAEQVKGAKDKAAMAEAEVDRMKTKVRDLSDQYHKAVEEVTQKHRREMDELKQEQVALEMEKSSALHKLKEAEQEKKEATDLLRLEGEASVAAEAKAKRAEEEAHLLKVQLAHEAKISKAQLDAALIEAQITTYGKVLDGQLSISQMRRLHRSAVEFLPRLQEVVAKLIADSPIPAPPATEGAGPSADPSAQADTAPSAQADIDPSAHADPDHDGGHPDDVESS